MNRNASTLLINWAKSSNRKPLILNGARQVGKSWLVRNLGKTHYKTKFLEINFEKRPQLISIFEQDFNIKRIVQELEVMFNISLQDGKTLLFFDEIQIAQKAIVSLRYFYEDIPNIPVIAAGSLLEFQLDSISFPVGRVTYLDIVPMDFYEFLQAKNESKLAEIILSKPTELSAIVEEKLYNLLQQYFWVGGMPACVQHFIDYNNLVEVRKIQQDLMYGYQQDFSKYKPLVDHTCLLDILNNSSKNIGGQIVYSKLSERFTGPTIKKGLDVLSKAKILKPVNNVSIASLPFTVSGKQFKLQFLDIGLLLCLNNVAYENLFYNKQLNVMYVGSWAEQFVGQQLLANNYQLNYWARDKANSSAEVDFVIQDNGQIIPIEVKSGAKGTLKSLQILLEENIHISKALVFSKAHFGTEKKITFLPIYWAGNRNIFMN
jgi:predicted AAA+ superfamily ATPase